MPTTDEIKQRLKSAWVWQKQLEADLQTLQDLEGLAAKITPVYSFAPGGRGDGDKIGGAVAKLVDLDKDIQNDIKMLTEALAATRELIKMLGKTGRKSLHVNILDNADITVVVHAKHDLVGQIPILGVAVRGQRHKIQGQGL